MRPVGRKLGVRAKTLKDVSATTGLSLITVSRALRQPDLVQPATREKVAKAISEIGYVPNLTARSLVARRSNVVGIVVPMLSNSLFADFVEGLNEVFRNHNMQVLLSVNQRSADLEEDAVRTFVGRQVDALVLTSYKHTDTCRRMLDSFRGPVVETWNLRDNPVDLAVGFDNFEASAAMTRYLLQRGYREIALAGAAPAVGDHAADRHRGFLATIAQAGRTLRPEHQAITPTPTTLESGRDVIDALMRTRTRPDAVFFFSEIPAQGALLSCLSRGLSVPGDIAIAGFGDLSLSALLPVPLTTVRIRAKKMGTASAMSVLAAMADETPADRTVDVGFELEIRRSA